MSNKSAAAGAVDAPATEKSPKESKDNSNNKKKKDGGGVEDEDALLSGLVDSVGLPRNHVTLGLSNLAASNKELRSLLTHRRLPNVGWSDIQISHLLYTLSTLDTNNHEALAVASSASSSRRDDRWCGVGEREGRVYSTLVAARHYGLSHGVGRSGDITEAQPKAVGSSVIAKLALALVLDAVRRGAGLEAKTAAAHGIVLPLCTGMSMALVLSTLRVRAMKKQPQQQQTDETMPLPDVVLWSRIDQKSCFKAITSAGLHCVVIPTRIDADQVVTDMDAMREAMEETYRGRILAVITTTSCFAPRVPDAIDEVAKLCQAHEVPHVINNAYGLQCGLVTKLINRACVVGRVDAIVCSTDKNFLVPVGGAIVLSPSAETIQQVGQVYPGRASAAPVTDLFMTLLSMGLQGYVDLLAQRQALLETFTRRLQQVAAKYGERLLHCPRNTISHAITLDRLGLPPTHLPDDDDDEDRVVPPSDLTYLGSMLFTRCVSGTRIIPKGVVKAMGGITFDGFGSSTSHFPHSYMTAACAIGLSSAEADEFFRRLDKGLKDFSAKQRKRQGPPKAVPQEVEEGAGGNQGEEEEKASQQGTMDPPRAFR